MSADRPPASSDHVRRRFSTQPTRDTDPEMRLRRSLHSRGYRYRVDAPVVKGFRRRADLVFRGRRVAVFVDGCFWHRCPEHGNLPKSNREWWQRKLDRNVERDRETDERLAAEGWTVVRIWEHEMRDDPEAAVDRVESVLRVPP